MDHVSQGGSSFAIHMFLKKGNFTFHVHCSLFAVCLDRLDLISVNICNPAIDISL